jgi:LysR family transcriptional regulator, carnitine catabolism transcriptional activator
MSLQTSWLRSFLAVADSGGFGAATLSLHLSQSRVSAHVAALEHALGVMLFERKFRPTTLTAAGELFRGYAQASLQELQLGINAARGTLDQFSGRVGVGSYPSVSSAYLPSILRILNQQCPGSTVELSEGNASWLESAVAAGRVDIVFRPLEPKMRLAGMRSRLIWREDVVAVTRAGDPMSQHDTVDLAELVQRPLIGNPAGSEDSGGGFDLRRALGEAAERANIGYLTDQPATLVALVRGAFGVGVINRLALQTTSTDGLAIRRIDSPTAYRDVALFWAGRKDSNELVRAFLHAQMAAELPPGVQSLAAPAA